MQEGKRELTGSTSSGRRPSAACGVMSTGKSSGTRSSASDLNTPENNTREQSSNGMRIGRKKRGTAFSGT
jgi:hypothetical protein